MEQRYILYLFEAFAVASVIGVTVSSVYEMIKRIRGDRVRPETPEQRIDRLTNSLREAMHLIAEIETEITARHTLAEKLQSDIETYDHLVELQRSEVEAVAQLLRGELQVERRRSFWQNVAINSIFFILGAVVSAVLTRGF